MSTRFPRLALGLLALAAISACGNDRPNVDMTGKWVCGEIEIVTTYEFRADGTFTKSLKLASDLPAHAPLDGKWTLDKDLKLHLKFNNGEQETRQIVIDAGIPSFAGEGQQVFYKKP
jgi:hypothetical protein